MARKAKTEITAKTIATLQKLPRQTGRVIVGGVSEVGTWVRVGDQTMRPSVALWLDETSQLVLSMAVIEPGASVDQARQEALQGLVKAMTGPYAGLVMAGEAGKLPPGLPQKIVISDPQLAELIRSSFTDLNLKIEVTKQPSPLFETMIADLSDQLGGSDEPPEPFDWPLPDTSGLPFLYQAAASFWRRKAWEYLGSDFPFLIELGPEHGPEPKTPQLWGTVLGNAGEVIGAAFYLKKKDFDQAARRGAELPTGPEFDAIIDQGIAMLRQAGLPVDTLPPDMLRQMVAEQLGSQLGLPTDKGSATKEIDDSLVVFFDAASEADPTYLDWMKKQGFKAASKEGIPTFYRFLKRKGPRQLDEREVHAVGLALDALNQFDLHYSFMFERPTSMWREGYNLEVKAGPQKVPVKISYPAKGYEQEYAEFVRDIVEEYQEAEVAGLDKQLEPATLEAEQTLYRLKISLEWDKKVWRRIEMSGDSTLEDLHSVIQQAFHWDNDHLYSFFLSGKAWDELSSYASPFDQGQRRTDMFRLVELPLQVGQEFLYIFDYGDELRHLIKLEAVVPGGIKPRQHYPVVIEERGTPPPQYGWDEEDDDDEE